MQNNATKILVVVLVLVLIGAVWVFRSYSTRSPQTTDESSNTSVGSGATGGESATPTFEVSSFDMDAYFSAGLPILINFSSGSG
jgi:hypothetical protein